MQQWLLARPEFREFLPTRIMVAYPEPWMDRVDAMKKLQGWTDTSVLHFRNLAVFGEQILLSIRWGDWSDAIDPNAGLQLGAVLAAGDPGLHPRLPRGHRRRPVLGHERRPRGRDGGGPQPAAVGALGRRMARQQRSNGRDDGRSEQPPAARAEQAEV